MKPSGSKAIGRGVQVPFCYHELQEGRLPAVFVRIRCSTEVVCVPVGFRIDVNCRHRGTHALKLLVNFPVIQHEHATLAGLAVDANHDVLVVRTQCQMLIAELIVARREAAQNGSHLEHCNLTMCVLLQPETGHFGELAGRTLRVTTVAASAGIGSQHRCRARGSKRSELVDGRQSCQTLDVPNCLLRQSHCASPRGSIADAIVQRPEKVRHDGARKVQADGSAH